MSKIKSVSQYDETNSSWGTAIPLGADADNIDITNTTTNPVDTNNTLSSLDDNDVQVLLANNDTDATAWTKFNRFRKRVKNTLNTFLPLSAGGSNRLTGHLYLNEHAIYISPTTMNTQLSSNQVTSFTQAGLTIRDNNENNVALYRASLTTANQCGVNISGRRYNPNTEKDVNNDLYLLIDKNYNRVVTVTDQTAWQDGLGITTIVNQLSSNIALATAKANSAFSTANSVASTANSAASTASSALSIASSANTRLSLNKLSGESKDLSNYSNNSMYTAPSDGYVRLINNANQTGIIVVLGSSSGSDITLQIGATPGRFALFVRKDMRIYTTGTSNIAQFVPFIN